MDQNSETDNLRQKWIRNIVLAIAVLSIVVVIGLTFWHIRDVSSIESQAQDIARLRASSAADNITENLRGLPGFIHPIAQKLSDSPLETDITPDLLDGIVQADAFGEGALTLTVAYNPEFIPIDMAAKAHEELGVIVGQRLGLESSEARYSPYAIKGEDGQPVIKYIEGCYDYTLPTGSATDFCNNDPSVDTSWYSVPVDANEATLNGPYWGSATQNWWAGYGEPFYMTDSSTGQRVQGGIVSVDLTLATLQRVVATANLREAGQPNGNAEQEKSWYGFIISESGVFLSHPIDEFVTQRRTIAGFDEALSNEDGSPNIQKVEELSQNDMPLPHVDDISGKHAWVFFAPIEFSDNNERNRWWLGIALDSEEIFRDNQALERLRSQRIAIVVASIVCLILLAFLLTRAYKGSMTRAWVASVFAALMLLVGIAYLWNNNATAESNETQRNVVLADQAVSSKLASDYARRFEVDYANGSATGAEVVKIPTGVFVQSIEFSSSNNVTVNGVVWQAISSDMPDYVASAVNLNSPGFAMPEADSATITGAYQRQDGEDTVYGWNFSATLRQSFDYLKYPFDREDVWIRMRYRDFDRPVILTPDLSSYPDSTSPASQPGLEQSDFVLEGWTVIGTFFSFRENSYNTNFGVPTFAGDTKFPELYFNVSLRRNFLNTFISNMIPIIVVATLLFLVLLTTSSLRRDEDGETDDSFGFSTANVLAFCAALFFVVIVSHSNMRNKLAAQGIIYLEWLYFVMYIAILLIAINSILTRSQRIRQSFLRGLIMSGSQNLLIKPLYWPVLLGLLLIITLVAFL